MDKSQKASLGCGTIILIALIVIIFGNMGSRDATEQVRDLRADVQKLDKTVAAQTRQIESLEQSLQKLLPVSATAASQPATEDAGVD